MQKTGSRYLFSFLHSDKIKVENFNCDYLKTVFFELAGLNPEPFIYYTTIVTIVNHMYQNAFYGAKMYMESVVNNLYHR